MYHTKYFFFSSRRRHTRSKRDWSSDVCSSDLDVPGSDVEGGHAFAGDQDAVAVQDGRQVADDPGGGLPPDRAPGRGQALDRAVHQAKDEPGLARGERPGALLGLPEDLAGGRLEGAHDPVPGDREQAAAVGGQRPFHEVAERGGPGGFQGEDGRRGRRANAPAGDGETSETREKGQGSHGRSKTRALYHRTFPVRPGGYNPGPPGGPWNATRS